MLAFIIRRLYQAIIVMLAVAVISFSMFRFVGDPVNQMVGAETSLEEREQIREQLGLNKPMPVQFYNFVKNAAQFEFGTSYQFRQPVAELIGSRMPATLELALMSVIISLTGGILMGVYTALHRDSWLTKLIQAVSLIGISLPTFFIGLQFIFIFAVTLRWLPSSGRGEVIDLGYWDTGLLTASGWQAILLPAITLGIYQMTLVMRLVRSEMMEVLRTDYIKFARARGLHDRAIHFGHALKNTLVPVITIVGLQIGSIIAFAIITEVVFAWPGMGALFIKAVQNADIPIMAAYLMLIAFLFVTINLIVDLLYVVVDPRIRIGGRAS